MVSKDEYYPALQVFIGKGQYLPGSGNDRGRVCYISLGISQLPKETYEKVLDQVSPPLPSHGGVVLEPVTVMTPSGTSFFPLSCNGDISGWTRQIEIGARVLGCLTAQIDGDRFVVSNGEVHPISACRVEFWR